MRRDDGRLLLLDEDLRQRAGVGPDEQIVVAGIAIRERAPDEPCFETIPESRSAFSAPTILIGPC